MHAQRKYSKIQEKYQQLQLAPTTANYTLSTSTKYQ